MSVQIDAGIRDIISALMAQESVQKALAYLQENEAEIIDELKEMVLVPGAPFTEAEARSPMYKAKLEKYGVQQCRIDAQGSAYGILPGSRGKGKIVIEGHLDTVFPAATPLAIVEKDGRLYCPGIGDDTAGLAVVLAVVRAIRHAGLAPVRDILVGGTAGEEGEGDIRGIKGILQDHSDVGACIHVEPGDAGLLIHSAVGSKRYEFIFRGPGGHSFGAYGLPSPLHAMGRAIAKMADVVTPENPKTTYSVGIVSGGTSVNAIANEGRCKLDMRSGDPKELAKLDDLMLDLVRQGVEEENAFRAASGKKITLEVVPIGDRPAGSQSERDPIIQAACAAAETIGVTPAFDEASSTNANAPISKGIPAVVVHSGGQSGNCHALDEWMAPKGVHQGAQHALLLLFALAGLEGVTKPLIE